MGIKGQVLQRQKAGEMKITSSSNILNARRPHIAFFGVLILILDLALTELNANTLTQKQYFTVEGISSNRQVLHKSRTACKLDLKPESSKKEPSPWYIFDFIYSG